MTDKFSIPISIIIAGGLIAGAFYLSNTNSIKISENKTQQTSSGIRDVSLDDHILGNPDADIILIEYSDTECPYCKTYHSTLQRLINEYGKNGKVAWVYRHFPVDSLHSRARKEAEATECANELGGQEKFWEYINAVYSRTSSNNSLPPEELPKIASDIKLNIDDFNKCLNSGKYADKVNADYKEAVNSGAQGTPYTIIVTKDGAKTPIPGAYPYEDLKKVIDAVLKD